MEIGDDGVEGLPLKLLIISLMVSFILPIFFSSYEQYDRKMTIERVEQIMEEIKSGAISTFLDGPGSARKIDLDMGFMDNHRSSLVIGGDLNDTGSRSMRLLWEGNLTAQLYIEELPIRMASPDGGGLTIYPEDRGVLLSCLQDENGTWVCVEKVAQ